MHNFRSFLDARSRSVIKPKNVIREGYLLTAELKIHARM